MNWMAIWVTFKLASLTSGVLMVVGLPIAYWLTFSKWRWKFIVESVVALPLVLPPTVLGFYILVAIGPHSPVGRFYSDVVGHPLPFTFEGLLLASILYSLPFAVQPFAAAFDQVDRRLIEASWTLGVSKVTDLLQAHRAAVDGGTRDRRGAEFCTYLGRVRRCPDGRRQHRRARRGRSRSIFTMRCKRSIMPGLPRRRCCCSRSPMECCCWSMR